MVCSESRSAPATRRSASSSDRSPVVSIPTTRNSPRVSVPVLSKITASSFRASSRPRRSRTRSPFRAPSVVEMATTSGIASPRAWGQAMTSTVTTRWMANCPVAPAMSHTTAVSMPAETATTVSQNAARSARSWARDRDCWASSTSRMIPARVVSSPVPVTSTRSDPDWFTVPPMTSSPSSFWTGRDSPVIMASFTELSPFTTVPSAGTLSPGRTRTTSPSLSASNATSSVSSPSVTRSAVDGISFASSFSAPLAWEMDRISIQWPRSMMVTSVASSHHSGMPGKPSVTARLNRNATVMASEISVIIPGSLRRTSPMALRTKTQPP